MIIDLQHQRTPETLLYRYSTPFDISIGRFSYINGPLKIASYATPGVISIGNFCSIAENVTLFVGGMHRMDAPSTYPPEGLLDHFPELAALGRSDHTKGPITIGHDVWIGEGACVLSGASIGTGAVIGARAVVTGTIPPYTIAAGNPARPIRKRFDDADIEFLLGTRWWDLPDNELRRLGRVIFGGTVEELRAAMLHLSNTAPLGP